MTIGIRKPSGKKLPELEEEENKLDIDAMQKQFLYSVIVGAALIGLVMLGLWSAVVWQGMN